MFESLFRLLCRGFLFLHIRVIEGCGSFNARKSFHNELTIQNIFFDVMCGVI